jgi:hypothetical protein
MNRSLSLASASVIALSALGAGCTVVVPGQDAGTKIVVVNVHPDASPPPPPVEASVLYVVNLERSSANLSGQYAALMGGFESYLGSVGLQIDEKGLIATYADQFGPRVILGRSNVSGAAQPEPLLKALADAQNMGATGYEQLLPFINATLGNISDSDIPVALNLLASTGAFDGDGETSEAKNVIHVGEGIDTAALPASFGGIDRNALFPKPRDLFIVVYIQPLPRRCALGSAACQVDGRDPADIFRDTDTNGAATWLHFPMGALRPEQIIQVAVATTEGESLDAFRTRCSRVPGFPLNLFDVMAPSSNQFFVPLMAALNGAHAGTGHIGDFCTLIGSQPDDAIRALGNGVAAASGGP